jgi:SAM-dependent methyltransferase
VHWLLRTPPKKIILSIKNKIIPNLRYLPRSKVRTCRCCCRLSVFLQFSQGEELLVCLRCRANLRYEMLAEYIREFGTDLQMKDVIELDRDSPLRPLLSTAKSYTRTFYSPGLPIGSLADDGSQVQDITKLFFDDKSFDLMISSEVLEHILDLKAAFAETHRVLRPGGMHIFTVPPASRTQQLVCIEGGKLKFLVLPPEYHGDPLGKNGILAYWHLGPDFPQHIDTAGLELSVVKGPEGFDKRIIWQARRPVVV